MPRRPRIVIPGIPCHITQRGNNRQPVFFSDADRRLYLNLLTYHARRASAHILGYCLMTNHVHLVIVPELPNSLSRALGPAHSAYTLEVNRSESRTGHLWQNRFFSCPLDHHHLFAALRYVDLNPLRAGLSARPWDWPWSSARAHTTQQPCDPVLSGNWADLCGGWEHDLWRGLLLAASPDSEAETVRRSTRTGSPLGAKDFVARLEGQAGRRLRILPHGRPARIPIAEMVQ